MLVKCQRRAMATEFAIWLVGDDEEQLTAIGEAALDEVQRVESVLSRFDPTAELARFNRHAATSDKPMKLSVELFEVLKTLLRWYHATNGHFDIGWSRDREEVLENVVKLDSETRTASSPAGDPQLDLGGFGKGYALDCAAKIVRRFEVRSALLHGGTSSVLAIGSDKGGDSWRVGLRDPGAESPDHSCGDVRLRDNALSSSAQVAKGMIDAPSGPHDFVLAQAVSVVSPFAADAEVYSTALLGMGKDQAKDYLKGLNSPPKAVAWIENGGKGATVEWIAGGPHG